MECDATISLKEIATLSLAEKDDGSAVFDGSMVDINFALFSGNTCPSFSTQLQTIPHQTLLTCPGLVACIHTVHVKFQSHVQQPELIPIILVPTGCATVHFRSVPEVGLLH